MFPKVPQSSLGILRVPQLPPPQTVGARVTAAEEPDRQTSNGSGFAMAKSWRSKWIRVDFSIFFPYQGGLRGSHRINNVYICIFTHIYRKRQNVYNMYYENMSHWSYVNIWGWTFIPRVVGNPYSRYVGKPRVLGGWWPSHGSARPQPTHGRLNISPSVSYKDLSDSCGLGPHTSSK